MTHSVAPYPGVKNHFTKLKQVRPDSNLDGFVPEDNWPQFLQGYLLKMGQTLG